MSNKKSSKSSKSNRKPSAKNTRHEFLRKLAEMCKKQQIRPNHQSSESE